MPIATVVEPLLSRSEQILYGRLVRAFPGHVILSQVALSRLCGAARGHGVGQRRAIPAAVRDWVASFVVCKADFTAIAVVELSCGKAERETTRETTREAAREAVRDPARSARTHSRQDEFLRAAGIKVVRLPSHEIPGELALKALVSALPVHASPEQLLRRAS